MRETGAFLPIAGVVLLVVVVAFGAYFLRAKKDQSASNQIAPQAVSSPAIPKPSPFSETANWKTYTNMEYKFEIKYPQEWHVTETRHPIKEGGWLYSVLVGSPDKNKIINISISADPKNTIDTLKKEGAYRSAVGNILAWRQPTDRGEMFLFNSIIAGQIVQITYSFDPNTSAEETFVMTHIISTFKFTD